MPATNTVTLVGSVSEPELRFTPAGKALCTFSIKVAAGRGKDPHYFDVTAWEGLAENTAASFKNGDRAIVVGRLEQQRWQADDGAKRVKVCVTAYEVGADLQYASADLTRVERTTPVTDF